jgi:SpoVK/Ycf46/Vps4 family AAA+-type ATPase
MLPCRIRLEGMRHGLAEADIQGLAASMHGFVAADVAALCQEATLCALRRIVTARGLGAAGSKDAEEDGGCGHAMEVRNAIVSSCWLLVSRRHRKAIKLIA